MPEKKRDKVYKALIDGAYEGLVGDDLHSVVLDRCPRTSDRLIVKASLLALGDPDVIDPDVLRAIYELAIARRTSPKPLKRL